MRTAPDPRLSDFLVVARAGVLAGVVLGAGAVSHVLGDGLLPPPAMLVVLFGLTAVGCTFFLQRPAGPLRLLMLVLGGQALVHLTLSVTAGHAGQAGQAAAAAPAVPTSAPVGGQSLHEAYLAHQEAIWAAGRTAPDPLFHLLEHAVEAGPLMVAAHSGAAAVVALWLAVGEHALATLLALTARNIRAAVHALGKCCARALLHLAPVVPTSEARTSPIDGGEIVRRPITRRGPPPLLLCS